MNKTHFQEGCLKTCLIVSAPGLKELKHNKPLSGQSGRNMVKALPLLKEQYPQIFPSEVIDDYRITNAIDSVLSKNTTRRTEARDSEILSESNLSRLREELEGIDTVVALGNKAALAVQSSGFKGQVLIAEHPSFQNINFRYRSDRPTVEERSIDRIQQWVESITSL